MGVGERSYYCKVGFIQILFFREFCYQEMYTKIKALQI